MVWEKYKLQPHDNWWMNFVRASRLRIEQLRQQYGPSAQITWLVYRRGYERHQSRNVKVSLASSSRSGTNTD